MEILQIMHLGFLKRPIVRQAHPPGLINLWRICIHFMTQEPGFPKEDSKRNSMRHVKTLTCPLIPEDLTTLLQLPAFYCCIILAHKVLLESGTSWEVISRGPLSPNRQANHEGRACWHWMSVTTPWWSRCRGCKPRITRVETRGCQA